MKKRYIIIAKEEGKELCYLSDIHFNEFSPLHKDAVQISSLEVVENIICSLYDNLEEDSKVTFKYSIIESDTSYSINEEIIINLFDSKWGSDIKGRIKALKEEFKEFKEEWKSRKMISPHLVDEAADVYSVALHIIHCCGLNHQLAIEMVHDKLIKRETNPEYKKFWDEE